MNGGKGDWGGWGGGFIHQGGNNLSVVIDGGGRVVGEAEEQNEETKGEIAEI